MDEDMQIAFERLAACKDLIALIEANQANPNILPLEGATLPQLERLEHLLAVPRKFYNSLEIKNKAGFTTQQVDSLYSQKPFMEDYIRKAGQEGN
jgi:hypothetical protein